MSCFCRRKLVSVAVINDIRHAGESSVNWRRLYATLQTLLVVALASVVSSAFYAIIAIGVFRKIFGFSDGDALLYVGVPIFVALALICFKKLPKHLRKAGVLSDGSESFGPWFGGAPK